MARWGCILKVSVGKIPSPQIGFTWLITEENFTDANNEDAISGLAGVSILNGGGNARVYTDKTKTVQLPIEVVTFVTGATPSVQVWGRSDLEDGAEIYLEADTVAVSQPAVTDTYGRNAVWVDYRDRFHMEEVPTVTNSAGNGDGSTVNSAPLVSGTIDGAIDCDPVADRYVNSSPPVNLGTQYSIGGWCRTTDRTQMQTFLSSRDNADNNAVNIKAQYQLLLLSNRIGFYVNDGDGVTGWRSAIDTVNFPNNTWVHVVGVRDGGELKLYINGVLKNTTNTTFGAIDETNAVNFIGALNTSTISVEWNGPLDENFVCTQALSADRIEGEDNNQRNPSAFWSTGPWEDQDAGGLTILPTGIVSAETFGSLTVNLVTQILQPSSISSLESVSAPTVIRGGVFISPNGIPSEEFVGEPSLVYLQLVQVSGIASQEQFGIAIIQDGVEVIIPVEDRDTYQKIQQYLDSTGKFVSEQNNGIILEWLKSEGIDATQFNDAFFKYWEQKGFTGAYNDKWKKWKDS